jgi:hypothetical protein
MNEKARKKEEAVLLQPEAVEFVSQRTLSSQIISHFETNNTDRENIFLFFFLFLREASLLTM